MVVGSFITIENRELTAREWTKLLRSLTFVNGNQEVVECYQHLWTQDKVRIPRGAWYLVPQLDFYDHRTKPEAPEVDFKLKLDDIEKDPRFSGQSEAVEAMLQEEQGQIIRPPGTGKSQIILAFAARVKTPTLILVHTEDILNQWIRYCEEAVPDAEIGVVRGKRCEPAHITIATVQTIRNFIIGKDREWWRQFGAVIADEGHHGAAPTWESIINWCPAFYRFAVTASPTRADGMHPALKFLFGPIIHRQKFSSPVKLEVVPVRSQFYYGYRGRFDWTPMLTKLVQDEERNQQIAEVVKDEIRRGNSVLVLSRRIEHLERIAAHVEEPTEILTGKRSKADRKRILRDFRRGKLLCLLATQLADEALDVPRLSRIVLTHPGKHEGRLIQQIGRVLREFPEKRDAVIYDVVDRRVPVLSRQWSQRKIAYRKAKITIRKTGRLLWR